MVNIHTYPVINELEYENKCGDYVEWKEPSQWLLTRVQFNVLHAASKTHPKPTWRWWNESQWVEILHVITFSFVLGLNWNTLHLYQNETLSRPECAQHRTQCKMNCIWLIRQSFCISWWTCDCVKCVRVIINNNFIVAISCALISSIVWESPWIAITLFATESLKKMQTHQRKTFSWISVRRPSRIVSN